MSLVAWTVQSTPNPPDTSPSGFEGVSCVAATDYCAAVGDSSVQPLAEAEGS
jgi:hypothetical protein